MDIDTYLPYYGTIFTFKWIENHWQFVSKWIILLDLYFKVINLISVRKTFWLCFRVCVVNPFREIQNWFWSVHFSSVTQLCLTLWDLVDSSTPVFPVHHQLPEPTQTHVHRVGDAIQPSHLLCRPLLLLPSIFPNIRVFSNDSVLCVRWPKY